MRLSLWLHAHRTLAVFAVIAGAFVITGLWTLIPPGDNPYAPLKLDDAYGAATPHKLALTIARPKACAALLHTASLEARPIADARESDMCAFENAVVLRRSATPLSAPVQVSCPLAATLYLWDRDVLQPLAQEELGQPVTRIEHLGAYACRRINGGRTGDPSQHATANAIDVAAFRLADGEVVRVEDWNEKGPRGRFLHELHDRSCALFKGVLGPEYNALHKNHFHLDMGPYALCR